MPGPPVVPSSTTRDRADVAGITGCAFARAGKNATVDPAAATAAVRNPSREQQP
jgi:hypothetical protein